MRAHRVLIDIVKHLTFGFLTCPDDEGSMRDLKLPSRCKRALESVRVLRTDD